MPEEDTMEMSEKEVTIRVWKMVLISIVSVVGLIIGYNVFSTVHNDQTALIKAQIDSSPAAKEAAQARYLEAKALSDRAMFEHMLKTANEKK